MSKILRGYVKGVVTKGDENKPWYIVGIESVSKDRDGFETTDLVKFMVVGNQAKEGLQNVYRDLQGSEVYAPYKDEINEYNGFHSIRYSLAGIPLRLAEQRPVQEARSAPAAAAAPAAQAKAS